MAEPANLIATCHCGRATIRLPRKPDSVTQCNCSLCTKTGFRGVYFASAELVIDGEFDSYVRSDLKQPYLANHRCKTCGTPDPLDAVDRPAARTDRQSMRG